VIVLILGIAVIDADLVQLPPLGLSFRVDPEHFCPFCPCNVASCGTL
jgi:hypothetical protein